MHARARIWSGALLLAVGSAPASAHAQMGGMEGMQHTMPGPLGISMDRMGSGTTWIPDAVPVPSRSWMVGSWMLMAHGVATAQYDRQGGPRGDDQFGSLNWLMLMASRDLAGGKIQPRLMLSLDPATVGASGYPLLLQSGETHDGVAIHDRQHPHDFWMEVAALYERELSPSVALLLYGGPSGEPALGPVAFMHRPSAIDNPFAPLSHHWQDATHISFGVVTAGVYGRGWRLEGSAFNGHEPDGERWGFDEIGVNSYSGRITVAPTGGLSLTAGFGRLDEPEALHPGTDLDRFTASVQYGRAGTDSRWSSAVVWGMNRPVGGGDEQSTNAVLAETSLSEGSNTLLARAEYVEKSAADLVVPPSAGILPERVFGIGALSLGLIRDLFSVKGITVGLGGVGSVSLIDETLEPFYGSRNPRGGVLFLRVRPMAPAMDHGSMGMD